MIELKNFSPLIDGKRYFNRLNTEIDVGDFVLLSGGSGSGKSTFLKSLLFFNSFNGTVFFQNSEIDSNNLSEYRKNFVFISQEAPHFTGTVDEFIKLPYGFKSNRNTEFNKRKYTELISFLNLNYLKADTLFKQLSGGEKQRLTIIQSLLLEKKLFLLDELTSSLDLENARKAVDLISKDKSRTVLAVSHKSELWKNIFNKKIFFKDGQIKLEERDKI